MSVTTTPRRAPRGRAVTVTLALVATTLAMTAPAQSVTVPAPLVVTATPGASTSPDTAFAPNTLVMAPGGSLTFANADLVLHNLSSAEPGLFQSTTVVSGATGEVDGVADLPPGAYAFLCTLHPTMVGTLTVLGGAPEIPEVPEVPDPGVVAPGEDEDVVYETIASTNEPMNLDIADDGTIVWTERGGGVNVMAPGMPAAVQTIIPVAGNMCEYCLVWDPLYPLERTASGTALDAPLGFSGPQEAGMYGILLDDDFAETNRVFLFYAVPDSGVEVAPGVIWGEMRLSAFTIDPLTHVLDILGEEVLLSIPIEWQNPAHLGGDLDYLPDGTISLTTGDNVLPTSSGGGYGPRDHRKHYDNGELTSANPADPRGKVLRLREDGSVPDGSIEGEMPNPFLGMEGWNPYIEDANDNVFLHGLAGTEGDGWIDFNPYVYSMGYKQPWRAVVMPNGDMYISDVGPDAGRDDPERGPRGFEEINRVPWGGGTHAGWPRCQGPNWSYMDVNWETLEVGGPLDCSADAMVARPKDPALQADPANSITGMTGATMYYPGGRCDGSEQNVTYVCDQWPIVGTGSKTSEPVVFYDDSITGPNVLPDRYRNNVFVLEWSRNFILTIPADPQTADLNLDNDAMSLVQPPQLNVNPDTDRPQSAVSAKLDGRYLAPIDAKVGPDGAIYFLEYGAFFYVGEVGRLSRLRGTGAGSGADVGVAGATGSVATTAGTTDRAGTVGAADGAVPRNADADAATGTVGAAAELEVAPASSRGRTTLVVVLLVLAAVAGLGDVRRRRLVP